MRENNIQKIEEIEKENIKLQAKFWEEYYELKEKLNISKKILNGHTKDEIEK